MTDMEPGIYGAAEVMTITDAILAEQMAAQTNAEPPPPPSRRARMEVS
jgi:hypothetical protein